VKEFLNEEIIANQVRLTRSVHQGTFVIVEGDTDARVYNRYIDGEKCRVVNAYNRKNALDAISILEQNSIKGVIAIVDADFDLLEEVPQSSPNIFFTDTHDLETLMIRSPALEKLLIEIGSSTKIKTFVKLQKKEIREILLGEGVHLGYLRWISLRLQHNLKFENLSFADFVDQHTLTLDSAKLIRAVKNNSQNHKLPDAEIKQQIEELKSSLHNAWLLCCGHDLISILSIGFRKVLGTRKASDITPELLERELRLAFETQYFTETMLYHAIAKWEDANTPFKILSI
jgi:hypothetical protein